METGGRHLRALPLPQHSTSLSKREFLHIVGVPIFAAAAQGTSFSHLALEARGAYVLGPLEQLTIGQILAGYCNQSFCERGVFACFGASDRGAGFRLGTYLGPADLFSGNRAGRHHLYTLPLPRYSLPVTPREEDRCSFGALSFATATGETDTSR